MQKRLFDRDPQLGITKYWHVKDNGEFVVETVQDMTGIAEYNKRSYNGTDKKWIPIIGTDLESMLCAKCVERYYEKDNSVEVYLYDESEYGEIK